MFADGICDQLIAVVVVFPCRGTDIPLRTFEKNTCCQSGPQVAIIIPVVDTTTIKSSLSTSPSFVVVVLATLDCMSTLVHELVS